MILFDLVRRNSKSDNENEVALFKILINGVSSVFSLQ